MNDQYEVHCGQCQWWGKIEQMGTIYKPNPSEPGDVIPTPGCPMCLSDQWLEYEEQHTLERLEIAVMGAEKLRNLFESRLQLFRELLHCQTSQSQNSEEE